MEKRAPLISTIVAFAATTLCGCSDTEPPADAVKSRRDQSTAVEEPTSSAVAVLSDVPTVRGITVNGEEVQSGESVTLNEETPFSLSIQPENVDLPDHEGVRYTGGYSFRVVRTKDSMSMSSGTARPNADGVIEVEGMQKGLPVGEYLIEVKTVNDAFPRTETFPVTVVEKS